MKGKLITFEGGEGSGKSTHVKLYTEYLDKKGVDYLFLREPGGTKISEKIRSLILDVENKEMCDYAEALLYASARAQLITEKIIPALESGKLVIIDRYIDSSFAYQGYARGLGVDYVKKINSYAIDNCKPDATVFLNISPSEAFERKGGADKDDRLELSGLDFHQKVYDGYIELTKQEPERFIVIDPSGSKESTHEQIVNALEKVIR